MGITLPAMSELCPICRQPLSQDSLAGLCPRCLSQSVFEGEKPEESSSPPPPPGTKVRYVGDYELVDEIAHGGMGVVYKARQVSLNRTVALKMILAGRFASATDVQRFRAEAEAAANLDHPHIVPIYEIGEHDGQLYFSMRLIEGGTLTDALARQRFTPRAAAQLMVTVARAVHHAHQRGILHRDLKPGNILLDQEGRPHITDFGLAKWMGTDSSLTASGTLIGSPSYMAPEQARGKKDISTASDVYSLGAILYELLVGKPPFRGATSLETLLQIRDWDPKRPREMDRAFNPELEAICLKTLEKAPGDRYTSAEELADDLQRWLAGKPVIARPLGPLHRGWKWSRRHPTFAALSIVSAIALLVLAGLAVAIPYGIALETARDTAERERDASERARMDTETQRARAEAALEYALELAQAAMADLQKAPSGNAARRYVKTINIAARELEAGNEDIASQLLDYCDENLRNWEWHYLKRKLAKKSHLETEVELGRSLHDFVISPCGEWLATPNQLWRRYLTNAPFVLSPPKGDRRSRVAIRTANTVPVVFNGRELFTPSVEKIVNAQFQPLFFNIYGVAIDPSETSVAVSGSPKDPGKLVEIFSATGQVIGELLREDSSRPFAYYDIEFSADGRLLLCAGGDYSKNMMGRRGKDGDPGVIDIWDWRRAKLLKSLKPDTFSIWGLSLSPDGSRIAAAGGLWRGGMGEVSVWDVGSGERLFTYSQLPLCVFDVAFSPDGKRLIAAAGNRNGEDSVDLKLWDMTTGLELLSLKGAETSVYKATFTPDGRHILAGTNDGKILRFNATPLL